MWSQKYNIFPIDENINLKLWNIKLWNLATRAGQVIRNCGSWSEIKNLGGFGLKITICPIFMKFAIQNKSGMLIINILIWIDDLDPKLQICRICF